LTFFKDGFTISNRNNNKIRDFFIGGSEIMARRLLSLFIALIVVNATLRLSAMQTEQEQSEHIFELIEIPEEEWGECLHWSCGSFFDQVNEMCAELSLFNGYQLIDLEGCTKHEALRTESSLMRYDPYKVAVIQHAHENIKNLKLLSQPQKKGYEGTASCLTKNQEDGLPFECSKCLKGFRLKSSLSRHIRRYHA